MEEGGELTTPADATKRYEALADLYYKRFGMLAPGKSEPPESGRDSNDRENRGRWESWIDGLAWTDMLDRLVQLEKDKRHCNESH